MKIVFFIKALGNPGGGAERVLCQVASGLSVRGHRVSVVSNDQSGVQPYYPLASTVDVLATGVGDVIGNTGMRDVVGRMRAYRTIVEQVQPDVAVGFMHSTYIPLGLSLVGTRTRLIASEHIGPEHYRSRPLQWVALQLTPFLHARTTVVSEQIRRSFNRWLRGRMVVVPNPVTADSSLPVDGVSESRRKVVLSVGRLSPQKDQRTLISAFALLASKHPSVVLRILGEGELRGELEAQVEALGIRDRVEMPGAVSNIDAEYRAGTLFVLPSRYESFGLATAEALLHGLPAVGFADCAGTNELIVDGVNGRLVAGEDRVLALSNVLQELLSDDEQRQRLASASTETIVNRFGLEHVLDCWESLLVEVRGDHAD